MILTLQPTSEVQVAYGVAFRVWRGTDENGTEVLAWVAAVQPQTHDPERLRVYEAELVEVDARQPA